MPDTPESIRSVLGIDYGKKRIGIATGQTITGTATPVTTLNQVNGEPDWAGLQQQIERWRPDALLVGIPYHTDGSESPMTETVRAFCRTLQQHFSQPIIEVNETLSSYEAEDLLRQHKKIGQHNKQEIDRMAAALIVQSWLDQH
ncbi:MAG: Holliday junction resolvase RuvX [Gammaproteobacteria bacterium]